MDTGGKGRGYSWFFFIGPPELRANFPDADWDKVVQPWYHDHGNRKIMFDGKYPNPGRIEEKRRSNMNIQMPETLFRDVSRQAERIGISVEDWLLSLAAESIRYEYVADRFFRHPANPSAGKVMLEVLDSTNDHPPLPGDEL